MTSPRLYLSILFLDASCIVESKESSRNGVEVSFNSLFRCIFRRPTTRPGSLSSLSILFLDASARYIDLRPLVDDITFNSLFRCIGTPHRSAHRQISATLSILFLDASIITRTKPCGNSARPFNSLFRCISHDPSERYSTTNPLSILFLDASLHHGPYRRDAYTSLSILFLDASEFL